MIEVTCAIIEKDGLVLTARRSATMHLPLQWEFPGGKLRSGEEETQCLRREIREELSLDISPLRRLSVSEHDYGDKAVRLIPFVCAYVSGEMTLIEHAEARWLRADELEALDWCQADIPVLREYLGSL